MLCRPYTSANLQFRELVVQIIAWPRQCHCQDDGTKSTRPDDRCPHRVYKCGPWCGTAFGVKSAIGQSLPVYNCKQTVSESCALRVRPPADLCVSGAGSSIISLARTSSVGRS